MSEPQSDLPALVRGLFARLRVPHLFEALPPRLVTGLFVFVNGAVSIAVLAALAAITGNPFVFPSLGPMAFLFFAAHRSPTASPRNTICGHALGLICGYLSLLATGLEHAPHALSSAVAIDRVIACGLALGLTGTFMVWLRVEHPPAGATALTLALGLVTRPHHMLLILAAVILLTGQAIVINRLAGLDYPLWAAHDGVAEKPPPVA